MTSISERQRAHFYIYTRQKIAKRLYIHTKSQTLLKKQQILRYVFIHTKPNTIRYAIFHANFETGIYIYTKRMKICVT